MALPSPPPPYPLSIFQAAKAAVMAMDATHKSLSEVLCGVELRRWRTRLKEAARSELRWSYSTLQVSVVDVDGNGKRSRRGKVTAAVQERAVLSSQDGKRTGPAYQATYVMEYDICHGRNSPWKVAKTTVVKGRQ